MAISESLQRLTANMQDDETMVQAACRFLRERDEARAHCERIINGINCVQELKGPTHTRSGSNEKEQRQAWSKLHQAMQETPAQSLREIQAEAVESAIEHFVRSREDELIEPQELAEYANQLRTGGNDNE